jgi:hypothetical protein
MISRFAVGCTVFCVVVFALAVWALVVIGPVGGGDPMWGPVAFFFSFAAGISRCFGRLRCVEAEASQLRPTLPEQSDSRDTRSIVINTLTQPLAITIANASLASLPKGLPTDHTFRLHPIVSSIDPRGAAAV